MTRRVAVTGLGVVSPLGNSMELLFANLYEGRSGIRVLEQPYGPTSDPCVAATAELPSGGQIPQARLHMMDRCSLLAAAAARQAIADARLDFGAMDRERCGVAVGTGMGGAATTDEGYRLLYGERSDRIGPFTVIRAGQVDLMLAGGTEAPLVPGVLCAWTAMRTLARPDAVEPGASCRPFAATRSGLVLGEGAAFVVLEEWEHALSRGVPIHAAFTGYGLTTDVTHMTRPTASGQIRAMRAALNSAGLEPGDIDYINAHGTATLQNDATETAAIKEVFGERAYGLPVSSTKSTHGHLLGAAGALEFAICVGSLERGWVPPTMHLNERDPACDLDSVCGAPRTDLALRAAMSNSFAFGGTNAVLLVERCAAPD